MLDICGQFRYAEANTFYRKERFPMAASHKKRTGLRAALIVLLCLVLVCAVAAAVLGVVGGNAMNL